MPTIFWKCLSCGHVNSGDASFCEECNESRFGDIDPEEETKEFVAIKTEKQEKK